VKRILIYGESLFLAGLQQHLHALPDVELDCRAALTDLGDLCTYDAVLIDLNDVRAADVLALLRARPDLRMVGVNADTSAVTVLAGQVYFAESVEEVTGTILEL
jgi:hypothetical protein